ncbi:branched-chain amino acid transport system permease protein [Kribbella sp. VKM Ac-2527]|uniref:Branched-chain amino acid transport system permease protein n=1 Tax=Kribbella caucasensis TaxID=2512215 RepID=A0A4R6JGP0_9ACTN|nr:branched-chain amino acid ABC transporter permease [Kribbella sp. VKM Ac-2527]TDO35203.1 branched-chain amino acid transport system permease protein [Kribbella sp. VKM Ac-2527]
MTVMVVRKLAGLPLLWRVLAVVGGLLVALALPWYIYPPVAMDIVAWALFAVALDLLLGFTGLLSFGHAAFWGSAAYTAGTIAIETGLPFPVAVLGGSVVAMVLAVPIALLAVRRTGIYFAMVTLAFAQMVYFVANQWSGVTGGENGLQGIPKELFGLDLSDPFYFYYAGLPIALVGLLIAWRVVHSPFGRVLVAIRENPARSRSLGFPVDRYKVMIFVISAGLSGLAGGLYAISHGFASLQEVYWTTSGKVVIMTVLGGIGTLWGSVIGAAVIVQVEDYVATSGINIGPLEITGPGLITGLIFVGVVLLFRRGVWGTVAHLLRRRRSVPDAEPHLSGTTAPAVEQEPAVAPKS